jgi:glycosyltransferase involved in cell wall biosynthesis
VTLSIIIPVWNDGPALESCLARLAGLPPPATEVVVADASSPPHDRRVAAACAAAGARLVRCPRPSRGGQLNAGAAAATGDTFVFTHADTRFERVHLDAIAVALANPEVLAGAFHKDLAAHYPLLARAAPLARWWTPRFGLVYGDQSIFLRRSTFLAHRGFADIPIMEDIDLTRRLRRNLSPRQFVLLDPPLATSMRRFHRRGTLRTRLENIALVWLWRLHLLSPHQIHRWYYRRKRSAENSRSA